MDADLCLCVSQGPISLSADWDGPGDETQEQTGVPGRPAGEGAAHTCSREGIQGSWRLNVKEF